MIGSGWGGNSGRMSLGGGSGGDGSLSIIIDGNSESENSAPQVARTREHRKEAGQGCLVRSVLTDALHLCICV